MLLLLIIVLLVLAFGGGVLWNPLAFLLLLAVLYLALGPYARSRRPPL